MIAWIWERLEQKLDLLLKQQTLIMRMLTKQGEVAMGVKEDVDALVAETERQKTVSDSVVTLLNSLTAMVSAAASNTTDPATAAALNAAVSAIKSNTDEIAEAVTANTPAA